MRNLDIEVAEIAINYKRIKKIKLPDAVILATAKANGATLITRNISDFAYIDSSVIILNTEKI